LIIHLWVSYRLKADAQGKKDFLCPRNSTLLGAERQNIPVADKDNAFRQVLLLTANNS
jgi:hypothetical protein